MEQTQKKPEMSEAEIEAFTTHLKNLNRRSAAESAIHLVVASIVNDGQHLATDQKIDLLNAALDAYRVTILAEFCRVLSSTPDKPYGLLLEKDDPKCMKLLQQAVALAAMKSEDVIESKAKRLFTLCEMLKPEEKKEPAVQ